MPVKSFIELEQRINQEPNKPLLIIERGWQRVEDTRNTTFKVRRVLLLTLPGRLGLNRKEDDGSFVIDFGAVSYARWEQTSPIDLNSHPGNPRWINERLQVPIGFFKKQFVSIGAPPYTFPRLEEGLPFSLPSREIKLGDEVEKHFYNLSRYEGSAAEVNDAPPEDKTHPNVRADKDYFIDGYPLIAAERMLSLIGVDVNQFPQIERMLKRRREETLNGLVDRFLQYSFAGDVGTREIASWSIEHSLALADILELEERLKTLEVLQADKGLSHEVVVPTFLSNLRSHFPLYRNRKIKNITS